MAPAFPPIEHLVPHRGAMRLVDRVIASSETSVTVVATLDRSPQFAIDGGGVAAYVGLEMMAQAVSAFDGLHPHEGGRPGEIGFLLGCRRYTAHRPTLPAGGELLVSATMTFHDGPMGVFECAIVDARGEKVAEGAISVYRAPEGSAGGRPETR